MNIIKSKLILGFILGAMFITALGIALVARANPLIFPSTSKSAAATTTHSYLTAGTATTTHQYDAYSQPSGFALDRAMLLIQHSASSSASVLRTYIEYSQDGQDWYQDGGTIADGYASTTKPFYLSAVQSYDNQFASTTAGWRSPGNRAATTTRAILVKTYTRFIRAVFVAPVGSDPSGVWSEWVPVRQHSEK